MPTAVKIAVGVGCGILLAVGVLMAGCFGLLGLGMTKTELDRKATAGGAPAQAEPHGAAAEYDLELVGDWRLYNDTAYSHAEGEVRNVSGRSLRAVQAVVTWYTKGGRLVTSDTAIVEYNPLPPGQVSPFHVLAPLHSEMDNAKLRFKLFTGEALNLRDP